MCYLTDKGTFRLQTMDRFWKPCTGPSLLFHYSTSPHQVKCHSRLLSVPALWAGTHWGCQELLCQPPAVWCGGTSCFSADFALSSFGLECISNLEDSCKASKPICRHSGTSWFWKVLSNSIALSSGYSQLWESFTIFSKEPSLENEVCLPQWTASGLITACVILRNF